MTSLGDGVLLIEGLLWSVVCVTAILDVATTRYGLQRGAKEVNPIARALFDQYGVWSLALFKAVLITGCFVLFLFSSPEWRYSIPLALAIPWGIASLVNLRTLRKLPERGGR